MTNWKLIEKKIGAAVIGFGKMTRLVCLTFFHYITLKVMRGYLEYENLDPDKLSLQTTICLCSYPIIVIRYSKTPTTYKTSHVKALGYVSVKLY